MKNLKEKYPVYTNSIAAISYLNNWCIRISIIWVAIEYILHIFLNTNFNMLSIYFLCMCFYIAFLYLVATVCLIFIDAKREGVDMKRMMDFIRYCNKQLPENERFKL